ncbi:MAG: hypothetical protein U1E65_15630 [Myxococcota bacterium]
MRRYYLVSLWLLWAAGAGWGCGGAANVCGGSQAALVIGAGYPAFQALPDTPQLELHFGPQGLYYVEVDLEAQGLWTVVSDPSDAPMLSLSLEQDGARVAGYVSRPRPFRPIDPSRSVLPTEFVIFDSLEPQTFINRPSKLVALIQDSCGRTASATAELTVVDTHPG